MMEDRDEDRLKRDVAEIMTRVETILNNIKMIYPSLKNLLEEQKE
jgi:hypothetical protein